MSASGLIGHWHKMVYLNNGAHEIFDFSQKYQQTNTHLVLNLNKIINVFYLLIIGAFIAFVIYIFELILKFVSCQSYY